MDVAYLDHNASSPIWPELLTELGLFFSQSLGNPSSPHSEGRKSRKLLNQASTELARTLKTPESSKLFWTSGGSEANAWVFFSAKPKTVVLSALEHESTRQAAKASGATIIDWRVMPNGEADLAHLDEILNRLNLNGNPQSTVPRTLVCLTHAHNETGVIQPVASVALACRKAGALFHVDGVQALGKIDFNLKEFNPDYCTISGHKLGALKGVGALVVRAEVPLETMIHGKQQHSKRGGTENTLAIASLGFVLRTINAGGSFFPKYLQEMHQDFEAKLKKLIPQAVIYGDAATRLPNTTYVGFEGIDTQGLLTRLDLAGICASSGSACGSGSIEPSAALLAMGYTQTMAKSSVRFSAGRGTTKQDYERVLRVLASMETS